MPHPQQPGRSLLPTVCTLSAFLCLIPGTRLCAQAEPSDAEIIQRLDSVLAQHEAAGWFRGAALVLVRDTGIIFERGYGHPGPDTHVSVDPESTVFRAASLSKLFVATAVLQLVESGQVDLDEDVDHYLHGFGVSRPGRAPVTLEALLTHTSGIENRMLGALAAGPEDLVSLGSFFRRRPPRSVEPVGRGFAYSNIGMAFAGYLVESVSGEPFQRYASRRIFAPLGMQHSSFEQPIPTRLAAAMHDSAGLARAPLFLPYPAASLVATPADMGRFAQAHLNGGANRTGRILLPGTETRLLATHWTPDPRVQGVAYGFFESRRGSERALFHTGDAGDHSLLYLLPDRRLGLFVVLRGTGDEASLPFMETLVAQLHGSTPPDPAPAAPVADAAARVGRFGGLYGANGINPFTLERVRGLVEQIRVKETAPGRILAGPTLASERLTGVEISPNRFQLSDGGILTFTDDGTPAEGATLTGSIWDPSGMHRIPWYLDARLTLATILVALLLAAMRLLIGVGDLVRRWRRGEAATEEQWARWAWRLSGATAGALALGPLAGIVSLPFLRPPVTTVPPGVTALLACWLVAVTGGIALWGVLPRIWRRLPWTTSRRVIVVLMTLTVPALGLVLEWWNLLGFRY